MEDSRRQDVASDHAQRRRGILGLGLFHDRRHARQARRHPLGRDDAIGRRVLARHVLHRDHAAAGLRMDQRHLLHDRHLGVDEVVGEDHRERLIAHEVARAHDRVPEAQRLGLAHVGALHDARKQLADLLQQLVLAVSQQLGFELVGLVEVILDRALAATGDEDEVGDAGGHRLLHRVLDERPVDDRQHLLGRRLGGGKEARAEARDGEYSLGDFLHCAQSGVRARFRDPSSLWFASRA